MKAHLLATISFGAVLASQAACAQTAPLQIGNLGPATLPPSSTDNLIICQTGNSCIARKISYANFQSGLLPANPVFTTITAGGGGFVVDSSGDVTATSITTGGTLSAGALTVASIAASGSISAASITDTGTLSAGSFVGTIANAGTFTGGVYSSPTLAGVINITGTLTTPLQFPASGGTLAVASVTNQNGASIGIQGGGASGGANLSGGNVQIEPGATTGTGTSQTVLYASGPGSSGSSVNSVLPEVQVTVASTNILNSMAVTGSLTAASLTGAITNAGTLTGGTYAGSMTNSGTVTGGIYSSPTLAGTVTVSGTLASPVSFPAAGGTLEVQQAATNNNGNNIYIQGGNVGGGTNLSGGSVLLLPGYSTGTGTGVVIIYGGGPGSSGTSPTSVVPAAEFSTIETEFFNRIAIIGGGAPTAPTCGGTGSVTGFDGAFEVTLGGTSSSTCTIDFGTAWLQTPICLAAPATELTPTGLVTISSKTTSGLVLNMATATLHGVVDVVCIGTY